MMTSARVEVGPLRMAGPRGPAWRKKEEGTRKAARMRRCGRCFGRVGLP